MSEETETDVVDSIRSQGRYYVVRDGMPSEDTPEGSGFLDLDTETGRSELRRLIRRERVARTVFGLVSMLMIIGGIEFIMYQKVGGSNSNISIVVALILVLIMERVIPKKHTR